MEADIVSRSDGSEYLGAIGVISSQLRHLQVGEIVSLGASSNLSHSSSVNIRV